MLYESPTVAATAPPSSGRDRQEQEHRGRRLASRRHAREEGRVGEHEALEERMSWRPGVAAGEVSDALSELLLVPPGLVLTRLGVEGPVEREEQTRDQPH